jgi:hypothetical protein
VQSTRPARPARIARPKPDDASHRRPTTTVPAPPGAARGHRHRRPHRRRQPEEAFDVVADFSSAAAWDPAVASARRLDDGPLRVGSRFALRYRLAGPVTVPLTYEITHLERPDRVVLRTAACCTRARTTSASRPAPPGPRSSGTPASASAGRAGCSSLGCGVASPGSRPTPATGYSATSTRWPGTQGRDRRRDPGDRAGRDGAETIAVRRRCAPPPHADACWSDHLTSAGGLRTVSAVTDRGSPVRTTSARFPPRRPPLSLPLPAAAREFGRHPTPWLLAAAVLGTWSWRVDARRARAWATSPSSPATSPSSP